MWTGLVNGLINAGWYALYGGLIILGIFLILVIVKCSCTAMGTRICTRQQAEANELDVLERLVNLQTKRQRWTKTRQNSVSGEPLLGEIVNSAGGKR